MLTSPSTTTTGTLTHINGAVAKAIKSNTKINYNELKKFYLEHIWNSIQFYDNIGRQVLSRSPKHVLLLHENDLATLFLGDLIQFLKDKGWKIIPRKKPIPTPSPKKFLMYFSMARDA
jgi:hypothetical protein